MEQKQKTTISKTYLFKSMNVGNDSYITLYKDYLLIERLKDNQEYCKGKNLEKKINYKDIKAVKIEKPSEAADGYIYFEEMNKEKDSLNQVFFYKPVSFDRAKFIKEYIDVYRGKKMKEEFVDNLEDYEKSEKVKCVSCGREVRDLEKGCYYCNNVKEDKTTNYNLKLEKITKEENTIAIVLKVIAWIILVLGFILGFVLGTDEYGDPSFLQLILVWFTYSGVFLGLYALAEIIQILHDIRYKVWKRK